MDILDKNIAAYEKLRETLEMEKMGKWVLIFEGKLLSTYDTFEQSATEAVRKFKSGPYLIRQIGAPPVILPESVVYNIS